jgi:hypothetical protein
MAIRRRMRHKEHKRHHKNAAKCCGGGRMKMPKSIVRALCVGLLCAVAAFAAAPVFAQTDDLKLKRSFGYRGDGESHVQMRSMLVPVQRRPGSLSTVNIPVTPVLTVVQKDKVGHVCKLGPRITDALLRAWHAKPMTVDQMFDPDKVQEKTYRISKTESQQAEDIRLLTAINGALQDELVTEILVVKGIRKVGGGAISKLPFASVLGCAELESADPEPEKKSGH